jgi:hypothetical protein
MRNSPLDMGSFDRGCIVQRDRSKSARGCVTYRITGMTYSAPARMPVGQRLVTIFWRV